MELPQMKNFLIFMISLLAISLLPRAVTGHVTRPATGNTQHHLLLAVKADGHPCGLFHPHQHQMLTISIANSAGIPLMLHGKLRWQFCAGPLAKHWRTLLAAPIAPALVAAGGQFTIHLPVTFNTVGFYRLIYHHRDVAPASGSVLTCIYRPSGLAIPTSLTPWIRNLPRLFFQPHPLGYIADYIHQTSIRRYILRLCWPPKPVAKANSRAIINPAQIKRIAQSLAQQRAVLVLAVQLRNDLVNPAATPLGLAQFLTPWLRAAGPDLTTLTILPPAGIHGTPVRRLIRQICLRGFGTARMINPHVLILGYPALRDLGFSGEASPSTGNPLAIVNIWAISWQRRTFRRYLSWLTGKTPVWVLPPASGCCKRPVSQAIGRIAPALALAQGAAVVPAPHHDFGLAEHWLGGASLFHIVHPYLPPFIAVFQGNHRCVAVLAGLGAATRRDQQWSALKYWPVQQVPSPANHAAAPNGFPTGTIIVLDPVHDMQAITSRDQPLPSPIAGWHELPLNSHTYYLESTGSVVNLVAALRTATIQGLPPVALATFLNTRRPPGLMVAVRNARLGRLRGSIRVKVGTAAFSRWRSLAPIPPGQCVIIGPFNLPSQPGLHTGYVVQLRRNGVAWQTAGAIVSSAPTTQPVVPPVPAPRIVQRPTTEPSPTAGSVPGVYHLRMPILKTLR